jgi:thiol-disulfide isomerase/thioredoxin
MPVETRLLALAALIAVAALAGLWWRSTTGRARRIVAGQQVNLAELAAVKNGQPVKSFGSRVTFLQFSGEFCAQCPPTARVLGELEAKTPGSLHIEVDITNRLDLANRFNILQTPTTLVLDKNGIVKSRISGAPKTTTLESELGTFAI